MQEEALYEDQTHLAIRWVGITPTLSGKFNLLLHFRLNGPMLYYLLDTVNAGPFLTFAKILYIEIVRCKNSNSKVTTTAFFNLNILMRNMYIRA